MSKAEIMLADAAAGSRFFLSIRPQLEAVMVERGIAGGNARDVMLGMLTAVADMVVRANGQRAAEDLFQNAKDVVALLKTRP